IILIGSIIAYELYRLERYNKLNNNKLITIIIISLFAVLLMKLVSLFTESYTQLFYIVPIATATLLLKLLINERIAFIMAIIYALLASIIFNGEIAGYLNAEAGIYILGSQVAGLYFAINVKDRSTILRSAIG